MAVTEAQIGYGSLLKLGNGASPEVFTTIAEVKSINGFGFTNTEVNVTHMESPNGWEEFIGGLKTGDTMTILCNAIRTNMIDTKAVWEAGLTRHFELNLPGTLPDYDFSAVPTGWHPPAITPGGAVELELQARLTAPITGS